MSWVQDIDLISAHSGSRSILIAPRIREHKVTDVVIVGNAFSSQTTPTDESSYLLRYRLDAMVEEMNTTSNPVAELPSAAAAEPCI